MKRSTTILAATALVLGLAAFAWAGGWGYGPMMGRGAGWFGQGGGWCGGPARRAAWNNQPMAGQVQNQDYYCPAWNAYPGAQTEAEPNAPQTSPNPGDQSGR